MFVNNIFFNAVSKDSTNSGGSTTDSLNREKRSDSLKKKIYKRPGIKMSLQKYAKEEYPFLGIKLSEIVTALIKYEKKIAHNIPKCLKDWKYETNTGETIQLDQFLAYEFEDASHYLKRVPHTIRINYHGKRDKRLIKNLFRQLEMEKYLHFLHIAQEARKKEWDKFLNESPLKDRIYAGDKDIEINFKFQGNADLLKYFQENFRDGDIIEVTDEDLNSFNLDWRCNIF